MENDLQILLKVPCVFLFAKKEILHKDIYFFKSV